jgi:hypothetical protein
MTMGADMTTVYALAGLSIAFIVLGLVLNPPRIMHGIRAGKSSGANGGKVNSFRENVGLIANIVGIIGGVLTAIQFFAGKS